MGKVGSRSIVDTLLAQDIDQPIFHVHSLTKTGLDFDRQRAEHLDRAYPGKKYWIGLYLQESIRAGRIQEVDIITLTRDPIARNLSAFFHSMAYWFPELQSISTKNEYTRADFEKIKEAFLLNYNHDRAFLWFDQELHEVFGVDVYQDQFSKRRGYQIYQKAQTRVLVLKLERLDEIWFQALNEFIAYDLIKKELVKSNLADFTRYKDIYQQFINWLVLPERYIERMYSSQYMRHFYTEDEIAGFRNTWIKGT
jgi:hypothetical protein